MSDTPVTDAAVRKYDGGDEPNSFEYVDPEDMRALERSRNALRRILDESFEARITRLEQRIDSAFGKA